jgi:cell division protein FtsN
MNRFFLLNKILVLLLPLLFISCSSSQEKKKHLTKRKPAKNILMLKKAEKYHNQYESQKKESNKPIVKPQFAEETGNKKTFYQKLFNNAEQITITDEVANNNIPTIKDKIIKSNPVKDITNNNAQNINKNYFFVQVGAYSLQENADKTLHKLQQNYSKIQTEKALINDKNLTKIKIGPLTSLVEAEETKKQLSNQGFNKAIIIHNK